MMSLYRRSERKNLRRGLIAATLFVVIMFGLDVLSGGSIRALVRAGGASVWSAGSQAAAVLGGSQLFESRTALIKENEALTEEVARLSLRIAELEALKSENEMLRMVVNVAQDLPGITVPVISSRFSSPYGTFMLGAGTALGIAAGDLVVAGGEEGRGFVIGRVSTVSRHSALALQLFAPDNSTEAVAGGVPFVALGRGGGNARALVPRTAGIAEGDTVTAARERAFPIGIVGSISQDPASAYQTVYIGVPVNLSALTFVYVIPSSR